MKATKASAAMKPAFSWAIPAEEPAEGDATAPMTGAMPAPTSLRSRDDLDDDLSALIDEELSGLDDVARCVGPRGARVSWEYARGGRRAGRGRVRAVATRHEAGRRAHAPGLLRPALPALSPYLPPAIPSSLTPPHGLERYQTKPYLPRPSVSTPCAHPVHRMEQEEVNALIREELRQMGKKPATKDFRERGQTVEKIAQSRTVREVRLDLRARRLTHTTTRTETHRLPNKHTPAAKDIRERRHTVTKIAQSRIAREVRRYP